MNQQIQNEIKTRIARVWLNEEGFVWVVYLPGDSETLEDAEEILSAISKICGGVRRPCLILPSAKHSISRDLRIFYIKNAPNFVTAIAAISNSILVKVTLNFMMGLEKTLGKAEIPVKIFTRENEALEWLKELHR